MILMRMLTAVTWLAVGASAVAWALHGGAPSRPGPGQEIPVAAATEAAVADWAPLLTGAPPSAAAVPVAPQEASRYQLVGLAGASMPGTRAGVVLLAVDGKPARAYRVGDRIDDRQVVLEISGNTVTLGPSGGPATLTLQAQPLPPPATGSLP